MINNGCKSHGNLCVPYPPFAHPPGISKKIKMERENES